MICKMRSTKKQEQIQKTNGVDFDNDNITMVLTEPEPGEDNGGQQ